MHISSIWNRNILANTNHDSISTQLTILSLFIPFGVHHSESKDVFYADLVSMKLC